jgi:hypothetical protein
MSGAAKEVASHVQGAVKGAAKFASAAQDAVRTQADAVRAQAVRGKENAGEAIGDAAAAIRRAADGLDRVAFRLSARRPTTFVRGARQFGRSNVLAIAAGATLVGVGVGWLVTRAVKRLAAAKAARSGVVGGPGPALGLEDGVGAGPGASASDNPDMEAQEAMATGRATRSRQDQVRH